MNSAFRLTLLCLASAILLASCPRPAGGTSRPAGLTALRGLTAQRGLPALRGRVIAAALGGDAALGGGPASDSWERALAEEMAKRLGARLRWNKAPSGDSLGAVKSGRLTLAVGGITMSQALEAGLECSDVYLRSDIFLLTRSDEGRFGDAAAFSADPGLRLGVQGSQRIRDAAAALLPAGQGDTRLKAFDSGEAAVASLLSGGVDALPLEARAIRSCLGAHPGKLKAIGRPLDTREYVIAFKPGSGLAPAFNAALSALAAEGFPGAEEARLAASPK